MQHRVKGQLTHDGKPQSFRSSDPRSKALWENGYSYRTSVGRWAVLCVSPGKVDRAGQYVVYASIGVARFSSKADANACAQRWRRTDRWGAYRARVVRWRRWMHAPAWQAPIAESFARDIRLHRLLGLKVFA